MFAPQSTGGRGLTRDDEGVAGDTETRPPALEYLWEAKLIGRAVRQRWPIPDDIRTLSVMQLEQAMLGAEDWRLRLHAIRILLMADRLNLDQEKLDRLDAIEERLTQMEARVAGEHLVPPGPPGEAAAAGEPPPQSDVGVPD